MKQASKKASLAKQTRKEPKLRDLRVKKADVVKAGRAKGGVVPYLG